jgi:DnaJ-class molecular chaperone
MPPFIHAWYATLGVSRSASQQEIDAAYHQRLLELRPGILGNLTGGFAGRNAALLQQAYVEVGDPARRQTYDALLDDWEQRPNWFFYT